MVAASSATSCGSIFSQNSGALFGLFRDQAVLFGIVSLGVVGLIVCYHGRVGRSLLPVGRARASCSVARSAT